MSDAYARFLFDLLSGAVYVAVAITGVSAFVLVLIAAFKDIFNDR